MDPKLCRQLNFMSIQQLAEYLKEDINKINGFYQELLDDNTFLEEINGQMRVIRKYYTKGICRHEQLESVDWFAVQRILLYVLIRIYRPSLCLETGVFYGGNTCFILHALRKNNHGRLISIDLPANVADKEARHHLVGDSEDIPVGLDIGFLIPKALKERWTLMRGDSHRLIPTLKSTFDFYIHDSDHSYDFIKKEMSLVWDKLSGSAIVLADDLDWSNGFFSFCDNKKVYPLIITDNGKTGLRVRTGIFKMDHPFRRRLDVVGL